MPKVSTQPLTTSQMTKLRHQTQDYSKSPLHAQQRHRTHNTTVSSSVLGIPSPSDWLWSQHRGWLQCPTNPQSSTIFWSRITKNFDSTQSTNWSIQWTVCAQSRLMCLTFAYQSQSISNHIWNDQHERTNHTWQNTSKGNGICQVSQNTVPTYFHHAIHYFKKSLHRQDTCARGCKWHSTHRFNWPKVWTQKWVNQSNPSKAV